MTQVTIPSELAARFGNLKEPFELVDENGARLGLFAPLSLGDQHEHLSRTLPPRLKQSPIPREEIERRLADDARIPHEEVMREVRKLV